MPADEYTEIISRLARIETQIEQLDENDDNGATLHQRVNERISRVEKIMYVAIGLSGASGLSALSDTMASLLG